MSQRFFVEPPIEGSVARLTGPEAQHLIKVMRAKPGDQVTLFDGSGDEFAARVAETKRSEVLFDHVVRCTVDRELPLDLTIGVALPKGDRQRWLVEKLTELGVRRLVPLVTARSTFRPESTTLARLRRSVIESSKQCGRNRLMEIAETQTWLAWLASTDHESLRVFAHPNDTVGIRASKFDAGGRPVIIGVGPEGGFSDDEVNLAITAGWQSIGLGLRILRVETAAVAVAATFALK